MRIVLLSVFLLFLSASVPSDFVLVNDYIPTVVLDLRYSTYRNFVGRPINGYQNKKCYITLEAARALSGAQNQLQKRSYCLKVFDAYRPQRAVDGFVDWAKRLDDTVMKKHYYPKLDKSQLFVEGYIASKSGHSRGSTVDVTIVDQYYNELDMGTKWDYFGKKSWPNSNEVTPWQKANRLLLQCVMVQNGFRPLKEEWWHFTLIKEPYKSTYFDFI
ncbi:MAG: M15 family metallopeptidase [Bacteroidia bacterium]